MPNDYQLHFMHFTGIPSGPIALSELDKLIMKFMSWVVACGNLNLPFCVADDLMAITLGWSWYVSMIFPATVSSGKGFVESPNEDGLVPEDFSTLLKISARTFS